MSGKKAYLDASRLPTLPIPHLTPLVSSPAPLVLSQLSLSPPSLSLSFSLSPSSFLRQSLIHQPDPNPLSSPSSSPPRVLRSKKRKGRLSCVRPCVREFVACLSHHHLDEFLCARVERNERRRKEGGQIRFVFTRLNSSTEWKSTGEYRVEGRRSPIEVGWGGLSRWWGREMEGGRKERRDGKGDV